MKNLLWIDLEMSGLDEKTDQILELAVIITDLELNPLAELHHIVRQPKEILETMNDWCKKTHGESGLSTLVPNGTPLEDVEKELLKLLDQHFRPNERIVIAGNSVDNDRRFITKYLPDFAKRLHYRIIDVSSFKEIFRERYGIRFEKINAHRAIDDIHESIRELKHYLTFVSIPHAKPSEPATS